MPEFARLGEEAILRREELTRAEFDIYIIVLLHSYPDENGIRVCRKDIKELCKIHNLEYHNTMRRFVRMRTGEFSPKEKKQKVLQMKSPWLKWEKRKDGKVIIPLVGIRTMSGVGFEIKKTVKNTVNDSDKTVKNTVSDCKNYSKSNKKTVKITVPSSLYTESFKETEPLHNTTSEKDGDVRVKNTDHKSKFSLEECLQYAKSQPNVRIPQALATSLFKSGEADAFIQTFLYPAEAIETEIEYDDNGIQIVRPLSHEKRSEALEMLQEMVIHEDDISSMKRWYTDEDWQWLMNQLKTVEVNY